MGVDEPNKLGRVAELVTIGGAFFNLVLAIIRNDIYLISIVPRYYSCTVKGSGGQTEALWLHGGWVRPRARDRGHDGEGRDDAV